MSSHKIIRDVIHGYIPISEQDLEIIDTPTFQRLKRIRHTTINSVYPCANHTRFEHSLGVMYLGERAFRTIEEKHGKGLDASFKITVRYACLLHDVGHAPLSHLGEFFYDKDDLRLRVIELLHEKEPASKLDHKELKLHGSEHELCSCAVALDKYGEQLSKNGVDLELMCRMITGVDYSSSGDETKNAMIDILNSGIDVDKLDYILRDSQSSGAKLVTIDLERLISAYEVGDRGLIFSGKALSAVANLVHGRAAQYQWLVNHHISVYTDVLYKRYILHLIDNDSKIREFFSYDSIANQLKDDYDLVGLMRSHMTDEYLKDLNNQINNRKYHKALWKTPLDFKEIVDDDDKQDDIITLAKKFEKDPHKLENKIISENPGEHLNEGDFFIALADLKSYNPIGDSTISIKINGRTRKFHSIFVENILQDKYSQQIPFIFYRNDDKIKESLLRILT